MLKMSIVGLAKFSLQCFDVLAWPLLSWVYPLCCSIRAIEADSISDSRKLNAYWVVFSLVLLFEHTFRKLLEWLPLWPYIRLLIVFCLVIPYFNGAFCVYKHLICSCLSMDLQIVINWFKKRKESSFLRDHFLTEVERCVKENGPALEELVASESERTKSNANLKDFKAVPSTQNNESISGKFSVAQKDITTVQVTRAQPNLPRTERSRSSNKDVKENAVGVVSDKEMLKTHHLKKDQEWPCAINQVLTQSDLTFNSNKGKNHKTVYEGVKSNNQAECKLTQTKKSTFVAVDTRKTGRDVLETSQVHKVFTCGRCQLTLQSKADMHSHLQGRKHKAKCEALKVKNQELVPNIGLASTEKFSDNPNQEPGKSTESSGSKQKVIAHEKLQGQNYIASALLTKNSDKPTQKQVKSTASSASKQKAILHEKLQAQNGSIPALLTKNFDKPTQEPVVSASSNGAKTKVVADLTLSCNICNVKCPSETVMLSHLSGKKHQRRMQQLQKNRN